MVLKHKRKDFPTIFSGKNINQVIAELEDLAKKLKSFSSARYTVPKDKLLNSLKEVRITHGISEKAWRGLTGPKKRSNFLNKIFELRSAEKNAYPNVFADTFPAGINSKKGS